MSLKKSRVLRFFLPIRAEPITRVNKAASPLVCSLEIHLDTSNDRQRRTQLRICKRFKKWITRNPSIDTAENAASKRNCAFIGSAGPTCFPPMAFRQLFDVKRLRKPFRRLNNFLRHDANMTQEFYKHEFDERRFPRANH